jgi:hypothetical protein
MSIKNSIDIIGNRTQDRPACSAVPQPTALPLKGKCKGKSRGKGKCKNIGVPVYARVAYRKTRFIAPSFLKSAITEADDQLQAPNSLPSKK